MNTYAVKMTIPSRTTYYKLFSNKPCQQLRGFEINLQESYNLLIPNYCSVSFRILIILWLGGTSLHHLLSVRIVQITDLADCLKSADMFKLLI